MKRFQKMLAQLHPHPTCFPYGIVSEPKDVTWYSQPDVYICEREDSFYSWHGFLTLIPRPDPEVCPNPACPKSKGDYYGIPITLIFNPFFQLWHCWKYRQRGSKLLIIDKRCCKDSLEPKKLIAHQRHHWEILSNGVTGPLNQS